MAFGAKIKLSVNDTGHNRFRSEIQTYVNKATKDSPITIKSFKLELSNPKTQLDSINTQLNNAGGITVKIKEFDTKIAVNKLRTDIQNMLSGLNIAGLKEFLTTEDINGVIRQISPEFKAQLTMLETMEAALSKSYKSAISNPKIGKDALGGITAEYSNIRAEIENVRASGQLLTQEMFAGSQQRILGVQAEIDALNKANIKTDANRKSVETLFASINRYMINNTKAYKMFGADFNRLLANFNGGFNLSKDALSEIGTDFVTLKDKCKAAGAETKTFFDVMKSGWERFGGWSLVTKSMTAALRTIKDVVGAVKELDKAMTELKKVTDLTDASYEKFLKDAQSTSQDIGAKLSDTVNATADFARLGYNIVDSQALSEAALVYKNVGDGIDDISEASESLISTIKAFERFGVTAENAMNIVDKFNEVGNNFAISSEGIGVALQKSASALAAANNDLEESIALATAMNSVLQDPEKVGTALKTVSMYLRAAKTEAEEAGESTDGMANSVSELRDELLSLTGGRVDIMIDDSTFKSTYQIMKELSEVWDDLTDVSRANILEQIGGKRNATAVTSLITNFQTAEDALISARNAAGSAITENEKYLDSIAGKISVIQAKFETLSSNVLDSGLVKFVLDITDGLISVSNALAEIHLFLPVLTAAAIAFANSMQAVHMGNTVNSIIAQQDIMSDSSEKETKEMIATVAKLSEHKKELMRVQLQNAVVSGRLNKETKDGIINTLGLGAATEKTKAQMAGFGGVITLAKTGVKAFGIEMKKLGAVMAATFKSNWIGILVEIASLLITLIPWGEVFKTPEEKMEELENSLLEFKDKLKGITDDFRSLSESSEDIIPRFAELAKGVDTFGKNISLTDEEYEEFIKLNNQIAELFPEINMGMDINGNAMLSLSYAADDLTDSLNKLVEAERNAANAEIAGMIPGVIDAVQKSVDIIDTQIEEAKYVLKPLYEEDGYEQYAKIGNKDDYGVIYKKIELSTEEAEKKTENFRLRQEKMWQSLAPYFNAWAQTDVVYTDRLSDGMQDVTSKLISELEYGTEELDTQAEIEEYIRNNIIDPIADLSPEMQAAVQEMYKVGHDIELGGRGVGFYAEYVDAVIKELEAEGVNQRTIEMIKISANTEGITEQYYEVLEGLDEIDAKTRATISMMPKEDLQLAYKIVNDADSEMSIDELIEKVVQLKLENSSYENILTFGDMFGGINNIAENVDNITSSMQKLREGTTLTKTEMLKLAEQYPEMLEKANLFTDGSIEGQKNLLNTIIDAKEQEYDAEIDKKIAELRAQETLINEQLAIEQEKQNILESLKNGEIQNTADQITELNRLKELEGINYFNVESGKLVANEEALRLALENEANFAQKTKDGVLTPFAQIYKNALTQPLESGIAAVNQYGVATEAGMSSLSDVVGGFSDFIGAKLRAAFNPDVKMSDIKLKDYIHLFKTQSNNIDAGEIDLDYGISWDNNSINLNGHNSIGDWAGSQISVVANYINNLQDLKVRTVNAYKNLEALKGLDLTTIYGSGGSSSGSSKNAVEEYIVDIDKYYEATKKLETIQRQREKLEKRLSHTEDPLAKMNLHRQLLEMYEQEADAERELMKLKSATIEANANALRQLGFQVDYDSETNELLIKNMEHLNDLAATSKGKYDSLQEATNALRKETEELIDVTEGLNDENAQSAANIEDLVYTAMEAKNDILGYIEEIYDKQIDAYQKLIDLKKEAIETTKDELDYEQEVADKVKEIAELQAKIDKLSLDDSRAAQAEKAAMLEELAELNKDLADTQSDHSYDSQLEALDKMAEGYEEEKKAELEALRTSLDTTEEVWDIFYSSILGQTVSVGDTIQTEVVNAWLNAAQAVKDYSLAISGVQGLATLTATVPEYHTGGVVGGSGYTGKEEILALLETGEIVPDDAKQEALYELVDFNKELGKRLGIEIGDFNPFGFIPAMQSVLPTTMPAVSENNTNIVYEPHINVSIQHSGSMNDADARRYGEEIASTAMNKLYEAFERKGINGSIQSKLRP